MKAININLVGDKPSASLGLAPELNIDPALLVTGLVGLGAAFLLPTIIAMVIDNFLIAPTNNDIDRLKQSIGVNKGRASQLQTIQKQSDSLEKDYNTLLTLAKQTSVWKNVLEEVRDVTPTDMWLTHLAIGRDNKIKLEGEALDYKAIAFFYTNLQNATNFAHPVLGGLQSSNQSGTQTIHFSVDCDIVEAAGG